MKNDTCQISAIHQDQVEQAKLNMLEGRCVAESADIFSLLGDASRLRILLALGTTELCVCDLAALLETSSSAMSHQLRLLRAKGIVRFRKVGKIVYYSLADHHVQHLLADMFRHLDDREKDKSS